MFDWIKFFPFACRDDVKPAEVRGPYLTKPKTVKWRLGDSTLRFKAPRSNPVFGLDGRDWPVNAVSPKRKDIFKTIGPRPNAGHTDDPVNRWHYHSFYSNTFFFIGPWFTGVQARLEHRAHILYPSINSAFFDKNLFHPRVFESAVASVLDCYYGYHQFNTKKRAFFRGPLNWRVLPISKSIQAIVCDIHAIGNGGKDNPHLYREIYIPVSATQILSIDLDFGGVNIYQDEVCSKPMFELCDSIIDSLQLEVGEQTQAEWDKVKATCPDMSITETFGELPWPLIKEKPAKKPKEVDITPKSEPIKRMLNS